jgi:hypothetical protein
MSGGAERREVDMSPEAIDRRLRELAQLYRLGVEIRDARRIGKVEDPRRNPRPPHPTARRH